MRDDEETDVFWGSWASLGKRKTKKDTKKDKKHKNNVTVKTDASDQKKKKQKNSKFKEAMAVRKEKKKKKKKKKNRALDPEDLFITQVKSSVKPETTNPRCGENPDPDHMTPESEKKTKRKKKVAFDLSPGYMAVKRPKVTPSSTQHPKESVPVKPEATRGGEGEVTATAASYDNASQGTSEDVNSQDLFITQKVFRVSPSEPSSDEASDGAIGPTPQEHLDHQSPEDPPVHRHVGRSNEDAKMPQTEVVLPEEEKDHKHKSVNFCLQTLGEVKKTWRHGLVKPAKAHRPPAKLIVVTTEEAAGSEESPSRRSTTRTTATQTENWFTTELSSYLSFCRKPRPTTFLRPLDLSLPQRTRRDLRTRSSSAGEVKGEGRRHARPPPSRSSDARDARRPVTRRGGETTPSPRSGSDPRSADTTASSEDNEPLCRSGRLDLSQVRAVQTRLNESFFFKTKGDGRSPRPESPLMKLAQGRDGADAKSRKGH